MRRPLAVAIVLGAAAASAYAVGNGDVIATPAVTITQVTGGGGSGTATVSNTTSSSIDVTLSPDVSCDPDVGLDVAGGDAFTLGAGNMKPIGLTCGASQPPGIERCLVHATDTTSGDALADLLGVCEDATGTELVPSPTSLSFGTVAVGDTATLPLALANASASAITKLFLQTDDLDGDFVLSAPCNPDAPYCDGAIPAVPPNGSATVLVSCSPRSPGTHTANLEIATDASQRLSQSVALACTGVPATGPVLGITPATVDVAQPVEVTSAQAQTIVRLSNLGTGTLQISDVRVVDVVIGAAEDWTFSVSGTSCTVLPCSLASGAEVDLTVTFDPSAIARRDASLLVSFHDSIDRTHSIPLSGIGQGATLAGVGAATLDFGDVPVGTSSSLTFQLANRGNRDTMPTLTTLPTGAISTSASSITVSPTMLATATAFCAPTATGVGSATITAQSTDGAVAIPATCNGTSTPLFAQPTAVALGEVRLGTAPQTLTFALASTGAPLTFSGQPALDIPSTNLTVGTLSAATTPATIDVTLDPQTAGGIASRLVVTDTAGDVIHIPIDATVVMPQYTAPAMLDIGTFCVGQPTASATATLQDSGTATLEISAPTLPDTSPFQLAFDAPTLYPASLAAADTATVAVTPERQSQVTTVNDMLTWTTERSVAADRDDAAHRELRRQRRCDRAAEPRFRQSPGAPVRRRRPARDLAELQQHDAPARSAHGQGAILDRQPELSEHARAERDRDVLDRLSSDEPRRVHADVRDHVAAADRRAAAGSAARRQCQHHAAARCRRRAEHAEHDDVLRVQRGRQCQLAVRVRAARYLPAPPRIFLISANNSSISSAFV